MNFISPLSLKDIQQIKIHIPCFHWHWQTRIFGFLFFVREKVSETILFIET